MNCRDCNYYNIYNGICDKWDYKVTNEGIPQGCSSFVEKIKRCSTCEHCDNGTCILCNTKIPDNIDVCELWEDEIPF